MTASTNHSGVETPTVSVVMPAFNAAATIEDAIYSVTVQSYGSFELIVVDDGSTDGTTSLVRELAELDRRIRLIEQANAGPSVARNRGVTMARGGIVAFLDSDDMWTPNHLKRHVDRLEADAALGVSFSPCDIIDSKGALTGECTRTWDGAVSPADLLGCNPTATCSSLVVRKAVFSAAGSMRIDMKYAEDQEWLFRIACGGWSIRGINERTVRYRTSPHGLSADTEKMLGGWQTFVHHAMTIAPDVVRQNIGAATASMHIYHARRAVRTSQPGSVARSHFARALLASPRTVAANSLGALALAGACLAPAFANMAISLLKGSAHA